MPIKKGKYLYFDFYRDVFKDNDDCNVYFNLSGRSTGKTYSVTNFIFDKKHCPAPVDKNNLFVLLSRDLGKARKRQNYFKSHDLICDHDNYLDKYGNVIGFNYAVTLSENYKSMGNEINELFSKVRWIIFDEFTAISAWDYVEAEIENTLSIISTVTRNRDDAVMIYNGNILNNQSVYNPYFEAYGIDWDALEMEIGDTRIIDYSIGRNKVKWALNYGRMAFQNDMLNAGKLNIVPHNAPALTGLLEPSPYEYLDDKLPFNAKLLGVFWKGETEYFALFNSPMENTGGNTIIVIYFNNIDKNFNPCHAEYNCYNDIDYDISILQYFLQYLFTDEHINIHKTRFWKGRTESEVWKIEKEYEKENNGKRIWVPQGRR